MDININNKKNIFKYRVNGVLIKDNKLLTVQIMNNGIYCCPGGHIKIGESSKNAVKREILEETEINVNVEYPIAFIENFFTRKNKDQVHEISLYYLVNSLNDILLKDHIVEEIDDGIVKQLEFKWINIEDLDKFNFQPKILIDQLKKKKMNFNFFTIEEKK